MRDDVLVCEISGRRPGTKMNRPTEKYGFDCYRHLIVSNDHDGYETDWEIVDVPQDYREWYSENVRQSDKMWQAQMNRSYALELTRQLGYRYCVQVDDNIFHLEIAYEIPLTDNVSKVYRTRFSEQYSGMELAYVELLCTALECTNAGMAGCDMTTSDLGSTVMREGYVYSFFALDVERCRFPFQGGPEDDIEYRLKLAQQGIPTVMLSPLRYGKVSERAVPDGSGCRKAYSELGLARGDAMRKLYGDIYSCGLSETNTTTAQTKTKKATFSHRLKPFNTGLIVKDARPIAKMLAEVLRDHANQEFEDNVLEYERAYKS